MRNCKKGYSCGRTCINRERNCTKELTGQSIQLVSVLASLISDAPISLKLDEGLQKRLASVQVAHDVTTIKYSNKKEKFDLKGATEQATKMLKNAGLYISATPAAFIKILDSGRFKSQFETGTSGGFLNPAFRRKVERRQLGFDTKTPDADRPIYGFVKDKLIKSEAKKKSTFYGEIDIELKPSIKRRATVTFGDSLNERAIGSSFDNVQVGSLPDFMIRVLNKYKDISIDEAINKVYDDKVPGYVEFQAPNITLNDIKIIHMARSTWEDFPETTQKQISSLTKVKVYD